MCSRQYHNDTQIQRNLPVDGGGGGGGLQGRGFGNVNSGTCNLVYTPIVNMIYLNIFLIYLNFLVGRGLGWVKSGLPIFPLDMRI